MKETGIIMSGNHPKLILDEIKTRTRRTWGLEFINKTSDTWDYQWDSLSQQHRFYDKYYKDAPPIIIRCPYGQVGDRLWVREIWATERMFDSMSTKQIEETGVGTVPLWYKVFDNQIDREGQVKGRWRSSRFMPRWASRITLEITELKVERVQEISFKGARQEGILRFDREHPDPTNGGMGYNRGAGGLPMRYDSTAAFVDLWDSLNAKRGYSWADNPWVWCLSFRRIN